MTKEGRVRVVPAVESREGDLCVEMRIRLYKNGAMSKLLDRLPKVSSKRFGPWNTASADATPLMVGI